MIYHWISGSAKSAKAKNKYTVSQKMHKLRNGITQNYTNQFWWNLAEIFDRVCIFQFSCRFACYYQAVCPWPVTSPHTSADVKALSFWVQVKLFFRFVSYRIIEWQVIAMFPCTPGPASVERTIGGLAAAVQLFQRSQQVRTTAMRLEIVSIRVLALNWKPIRPKSNRSWSNGNRKPI